MYIGNNPIAMRSQKCFSKAIFTLLETKPFVKITVKDICSEAKLSRQTFYQFFSTKEDVIRFQMRELFLKFNIQVQELNGIAYPEMSSHFFRFFKENKNFIDLLLKNRLAYILIEELTADIEKISKDRNLELADNHSIYASVFLSGALSHTLLYWLKDENQIPEEELSQLLYQIIHGDYFKTSKTAL